MHIFKKLPIRKKPLQGFDIKVERNEKLCYAGVSFFVNLNFQTVKLNNNNSWNHWGMHVYMSCENSIFKLFFSMTLPISCKTEFTVY